MNDDTPEQAPIHEPAAETTAADVASPPRRFRRLRRFLRWSLVLVAALAVAWLGWLWYETAALAGMEREAEETGLPRSAERLLPPVSDEDNAIVLYERAFIRMSEDRPEHV